MTRSKFSTKAILLAAGIGLSTAAFAGSQPAAAQSYSGEYACPAGTVYDPTYGCTLPGDAYEPHDFGYYGYLPYGTYGSYYAGHRECGHGLDHGMAGGFDHGVGFANAGGFGHGFAHGMAGRFDHGVGFAHAGGLGHGVAGGFHGGGGGHR